MLGSLPYFLTYFGSAILMAVVFLTAYVAITPHKEFALIRDGNSAAALQLVGTFMGWTIPMTVVIGFSHHITDMVVWGAVSLITQLVIFFVISRIVFRGIEARIGENCHASGLFVGGVGMAFGILQAGCMVP
jgi:putative membrane protein